ncbi:MAG: DegT/DnrJ/EryC1/StrS family aminotransferase [Candidatus Eisenbacteria bacterium]|nr:DegT/DnrJ/EryC1/StrS family aminotransferase [Candidatus Eisenbacteria bacterium]
MNRPAILGGPAPPDTIPISEPTLPDFDSYARELRAIFESRQITNDRWVRRLEEEAAERLGVPEAVALSSATSGLILVAKLLGLKGRVLLPSFTFPATLHILLWNGLEPQLLDCDPESFNLDPVEVERALAAAPAAAVVPVYIFGNAPDWGRLEPLLATRGVASFSDAAHALGTRLGDRMAGSFGEAEIFSLAPTKVTVSGEGGIVATRNRELARDLRVARNYGNPGDYDCVVAGLNARQSELHALLGFLSLSRLEENVERRARFVTRYREGLEDVPGLSFQRIDPACRSTHNYFAIRVDAGRFGLSNRELQQALHPGGIRSKIYFHPPLHKQTRFRHLPGLGGNYPNTERVCAEVLCLPLYTHMTDEIVDRVVEGVRACREHAPAIRAKLEGRTA